MTGRESNAPEGKKSALQLFRNGYNCAQSVSSAFSDVFGADDQLLKAVSAGFGGGYGRMQRTCGAVSGGIMVLGLMHYDGGDVAGSKERAYAATAEFVRRFQDIHGTIECSELLGVDLHTEAGRQALRERNLTEAVCQAVIAEVCDILVAMLSDRDRQD